MICFHENFNMKLYQLLKILSPILVKEEMVKIFIVEFLLFLWWWRTWRRHSDAEKAAESWKRYLRRDDSKIVDLFVGQLKSTLQCTVCGHCSVTFDPFWDLSLPIPSSAKGNVKLHHCLDLFVKEEILDGDEKPVNTLSTFAFIHSQLTRFELGNMYFINPNLQFLNISNFFLSFRLVPNVKLDASAPKSSPFTSFLRFLSYVRQFDWEMNEQNSIIELYQFVQIWNGSAPANGSVNWTPVWISL